MVTLTHVFVLIGIALAAAALIDALERRWVMAAFWLITAVPFFIGDQITDAVKAGVHWPAQAMGGGVIALAVLATLARPFKPASDEAPARAASADRLGNWLFVPALGIPVFTFALYAAVTYLPQAKGIFDPAQSALISLGVGSVLALIVAHAVTRAPPIHAATESRRLLDTMGWAALLPIMLATLGGVFKEAGVGDAISALVLQVVPVDNRYACLLAYAIGMIAFTVITGNAFTAFPVMLAGIGLPLLIQRHHANAAALGAIGMVTGYCGTLLTPMAANYNIVPVLLLDLRSDYAVIREQRPTAFALIAVNLILMAVLVF